ncbi:MAG TPA: 2-oxoglutarate-dependent dioxygenase, partial [Burkholderiaceae bacterium]|nr:2-oxoglutarate-dependent dioxygenase [Burkholderiaceae bacterium]
MDSSSTTGERRQFISPDLRQWIIAQAQAGVSPQQVLDAMKTSGWQEDIAIQALEETLQAHLSGHARTVSAQAAADSPLTEGVPVPNPALEGCPCRLHALDREVNILATMATPR